MFILCSIDGMRPDGLVQAETPNIDRLIVSGSSSLTARTVLPCCTLPCHTSMHRGVPPERHGITTNVFTPLVRPVPSLFDHAKSNGRRTAFFFNWAQLRDLAEPDSVDTSILLNNTHKSTCDDEVADSAIKHLRAEPADIVFLYLGGTDSRGHEHGWMSDP